MTAGRHDGETAAARHVPPYPKLTFSARHRAVRVREISARERNDTASHRSVPARPMRAKGAPNDADDAAGDRHRDGPRRRRRGRVRPGLPVARGRRPGRRRAGVPRVRRRGSARPRADPADPRRAPRPPARREPGDASSPAASSNSRPAGRAAGRDRPARRGRGRGRRRAGAARARPRRGGARPAAAAAAPAAAAPLRRDGRVLRRLRARVGGRAADDVLDRRDPGERRPRPRPAARWARAHVLGPVLAAAFANSPLRLGRPCGWMSARQAGVGAPRPHPHRPRGRGRRGRRHGRRPGPRLGPLPARRPPHGDPGRRRAAAPGARRLHLPRPARRARAATHGRGPRLPRHHPVPAGTAARLAGDPLPRRAAARATGRWRGRDPRPRHRRPGRAGRDGRRGGRRPRRRADGGPGDRGAPPPGAGSPTRSCRRAAEACFRAALDALPRLGAARGPRRARSPRSPTGT